LNALVIGAAVSGRAVARLLADDAVEVRVYDADPRAVAGLEELGFDVHSGEWSDRYLEGVELVVTSPGVPEHAGPIMGAQAAGLPVWSELEAGWRKLGAPVVAVTGTNGKTTVTRLIAAILNAADIRSVAAGNIGTPLSAVAGSPWDLVVVEASSFQLRFIEDFHPEVAVVLNIAPDHLDWHGSFEAYRDAKARILENQSPEDAVVFDGDDEGAVGLVAGAASRPFAVSGSRRLAAGGVEDGKIWVRDRAIDGPRDLDAAFGLDIVAAAVAALEVGANHSAAEAALAEFTPEPHRRTVVAHVEGVTWVDDSKATNPHAALASIAGYPSVVLIAGGRTKGLDPRPLATAPGVKAVIAIGEAGSTLAEAGGARVAVADGMKEAVDLAREKSEPGDTVLLAPGCASFDMFESYAARGDAFADAVLETRSAP
jgi:UDP-N-acetylmuramoylalanine--D-glutamate ligase